MDKVNQETLRGIRAALDAGHSWDEIADNIASRMGVDISAARGAGASSEDIVVHLLSPREQAKPENMPQRPFMAGVGRGMEDVVAGVADLLPDAIEPTGFVDRSRRRAETYDEANKDIGFDGGRMLGQAAALAPLALAGPAATASTGVRIAGNSALGATAGYIPLAKDNSERLGNAAVGAVAGAVVPEVVRAGVGQVVKGVNKAKAAFNKANIGQMVDDVVGRMLPSGTQADDVVANVKKYLNDLALEQVKATGKVDQAIIERAAKIASVDPTIKPTLGQLTRDAATLSAERNLANSGTPAGNLIAERYRGQERALRDAARRLEESTGGMPLSPYDYGNKAGELLRGKWKEMQEEVSKAYDAAESQHGATPVDIGGLVRQVADTAYTEGSETATGKMANIALNRLKSYGLFDASGNLKEGAHLTVGQLRDLRQALSGVDLSGATTAQTMRARGGLINAIDDAVEASPVGDVFKPARQMARQRFSEFADKTLKQIQQDGIRDEDLFRLVTRGVDTSRDFVQALTTGTPDQVATGQQVLADTRRKMIADILSRATSGGRGEEVFSPATLRNKLDPLRGGYHPEVVDAVLGDAQKPLQDFVDVVGMLRDDPSFNSINYSKSGALLSGLGDGGRGLAARLTGSGGLVDVAAKVAGERQQQKLAEALLAGNPGGLPGFGRVAVEDALTANPPKFNRRAFWSSVKEGVASPETYRALLIDALLGGGRQVPATAYANNQ